MIAGRVHIEVEILEGIEQSLISVGRLVGGVGGIGNSGWRQMVNCHRVEELDMDAVDVLGKATRTFAPLLRLDAVWALEPRLHCCRLRGRHEVAKQGDDKGVCQTGRC